MSAPSPESDDASLVAATLAGEENAFSLLVRRHKEKVYRFVRSYVADADEAYDLAQEAFAAAWSALARYDADRPFPAWIKRIALNKCRDWARRRAVRRFFFGAESIETSPDLPATIDPDDEALQRNLSRLDQAIAALPAGLKEPLLLTAIDGMSHHDAARVLHLTPKAVETRVYRAKLALSRALRDE
ncbi:MAG: RNA polymerase sigma factor [Hyphomonadaceae bacterium]|nr:RNA polymerase sigma factor [Hyphomonadaceae bacterium]